MISQRWFMWWIEWVCTVRKQAFAWANVGPNLCHHMTSQSLREFNTRLMLLPFCFGYFSCLIWLIELRGSCSIPGQSNNWSSAWDVLWEATLLRGVATHIYVHTPVCMKGTDRVCQSNEYVLAAWEIYLASRGGDKVADILQTTFSNAFFINKTLRVLIQF